MDADVLVVGAGPVGLLLAAELRLAGATPLVLERLAEPAAERRARGIGPLAKEALGRRGLGEALAKYQSQGLADKASDHGSEKQHFAWIYKIDPALQEEPGRTGALIWQPDLERVLAGHAAELGVTVLREHEVTALEQDGEGVTVTVRTPAGERRLSAAYLVGCDGGRSTVRGLAGYDFPGTEPLMISRRAAVDLADPEKLPDPGWTPAGYFVHQSGMAATFDFDVSSWDRDQPFTAAEMQASLRRVTGADVTVTAVRDPLRFSDGARQVSAYRLGRVLLAGDAAHVHSPNGGQGLNLGLMDAVNLGWKLAATALGRAPEGLLDSYHAERHPAGAAVLHNTRAASAMLRPGPHVAAMRDILSDLLDFPDVNRYFGRMLNGLAARYRLPYPVEHPLAGHHCPELAFGDGVTLAGLAARGRPLLVHVRSRRELAEAAAAWHGVVDVLEVDVIETETGTPGLSAALIRPDGAVAWAAPPAPLASSARSVPAPPAAPAVVGAVGVDGTGGVVGADREVDVLKNALGTWFLPG
jgi:2-polyprenyl-6-methoxyphenol hydroxylase-like FAD-dependent oxidoreductase